MPAYISDAQQNSLDDLIKEKGAIRVYTSDFTDQTGSHHTSPERFKEYFKDALSKRKVLKFELVEEPAGAHIEIRARLKRFEYLEKDPITTFISPAAFALDALTHENYAKIVVGFTVIDARCGFILWDDDVSCFVKGKMSVEESIPRLYDKVSRRFLWKCFGRPSKLRYR